MQSERVTTNQLAKTSNNFVQSKIARVHTNKTIFTHTCACVCVCVCVCVCMCVCARYVEYYRQCTISFFKIKTNNLFIGGLDQKTVNKCKHKFFIPQTVQHILQCRVCINNEKWPTLILSTLSVCMYVCGKDKHIS